MIMISDVVSVSPICPNAICLVFCIDQEYAPQASCAIWSILEQRKSLRSIDVIIISNSASSPSFRTLQREFAEESNFKIRILSSSNIDLSKYHSPGYFSSAMYLRLFIPNILVNYDKILYIDADTIVRADIGELFDTDVDQFACAAIKDPVDDLIKIGWKVRLSGDLIGADTYFRRIVGVDPSSYFNSGVILMNLKYMRQINFVDRALDVIFEEFVFPDQDIFNKCVNGSVRFVDPRWNLLPQASCHKDWISNGLTPYIIHYASADKPWINRDAPLADVFWSYAERGAFHREIKGFLQTDSSSIDNPNIEVRTLVEPPFRGSRLTRVACGLACADRGYWEQLRRLCERINRVPRAALGLIRADAAYWERLRQLVERLHDRLPGFVRERFLLRRTPSGLVIESQANSQEVPEVIDPWRHALSQESLKERFEVIYRNNLWGSKETVCGEGSEIAYTEPLRTWMIANLYNYSIRKIVDAPCGDFNWMKLVTPKLDIEYIGIDIVSDIIKKNNLIHQDKKHSFFVGNICEDKLPACDLLIVRDCLFHMSFSDIEKFLVNISRVQYKYLLTTSHILGEDFQNFDIRSGEFRLIDLFRAPFHFPKYDVLERVADYPEGHPLPREMLLIAKERVPTKLSY